MNQKGISTLVIAVIVVIVVAVIGVGVYLAMSGTGGTGGNGGNGGTTPNVEGATSLSFKVEVTSGGTSYTNTYMAKNIGTSNMMIRIEIASADGDIVYIVNGADKKAWAYMAGEWTDLSDAFSTEWDSWSTTVSGYKSNLADWTGTGEWTYTEADGSKVRIFDISVNPSLADSLFQHS